jgi:alpha-glucosidase
MVNRPSEIIYQIYPASFMDANGDGHGDLKGITQRLDYIKSLQVDAIWISPFFKSPDGPKGDGGYAISDYRQIGQKFGTMEDFDVLIKEAQSRGIRVYTDFVMCHTSNEHEWFEKSRNREPVYEDRYVWSPGKKDTVGNLILVDGKPIPPNNWKSVFGGPAWTYDDKRQEFYLHHFNNSQPALNANQKHVQEAILGEMKIWLDKGVSGLRLDALPYANYDPQLRDNPWMWNSDAWNAQYFEHSICQPQTVDYVRRIRKLFDSYEARGLGKRTAIGEAIAGKNGGLGSMEIASTYIAPKTGLDMCYTEMQFWRYPSAREMRDKLNSSLQHFPDGSICNVLSNHDFSRASSRMLPPDAPEDLRTTILKQLMTINFSLPGSVCMYQGEELGLPDARIPEDIPYDKMQDLLDSRCRDIARCPIPWDHRLKNAGFSGSDTPYLPMPESYAARAVNIEEAERGSMLNFTRSLIAERQNSPALRIGDTKVLNINDELFAFTRSTEEQTVLIVANMGPYTIEIKPSDFLDQQTLEKLHMTEDSKMIIGPYDVSKRGLSKPKTPSLSNVTDISFSNGHLGKKLFALDFLLADVFYEQDEVNDIVTKNGWQPGDRVSISRETHQELSKRLKDAHPKTIGGATVVTMQTLKSLQPGGEVNVDFLGVTGSDPHGAMIRKKFSGLGINILVPSSTNDALVETSVSHIIKTGGREIIATYPGTETQALQKALEENPTLLESSIAKADIVYLPGSITEKFGQTLTDEILRLRWKYKKELILALPSHAKYGPHDAETFKNLIKSANVIVGNDLEFCRTYGMKDVQRPISDSQMLRVTENIQKALSEDVLFNNDMPSSPEPVALITRGHLPAILITANTIEEIPVPKIGVPIGQLGSGDVSTAAFIDATLRGLSHSQSAHYAVAIGAKKARQDAPQPSLVNASEAQTEVLNQTYFASILPAFESISPPRKISTKPLATNDLEI